MSSKIDGVPRELLERLQSQTELSNDWDEVQALLAAPVVERQPEPVGYANSNDLVSDGYSHSFTVRSEQPANNYVDGGIPVALYASPPAPVVELPTREVMRDLIAEVIGGDTYDCTRVWSAWGVGTMSEDDFVPLAEREERLYELADACLDRLSIHYDK